MILALYVGQTETALQKLLLVKEHILSEDMLLDRLGQWFCLVSVKKRLAATSSSLITILLFLQGGLHISSHSALPSIVSNLQ